MFQRRHMIAIADVLKVSNLKDATVLENLMQMFEMHNPNFDRGIFLKACGWEE